LHGTEQRLRVPTEARCPPSKIRTKHVIVATFRGNMASGALGALAPPKRVKPIPFVNPDDAPGEGRSRPFLLEVLGGSSDPLRGVEAPCRQGAATKGYPAVARGAATPAARMDRRPKLDCYFRRGHLGSRPVRFCALPLVYALVLAPAGASATPSRTDLRAALSTFERTDNATLRSLGTPEEIVAGLVALYDDPREPPFVRMRAVRAVSMFPLPASRTFLLAVAETSDQSDLFVREALLALSHAFGAVAATDLRPFLSDARPVVREAAVVGLSTFMNPTVRRWFVERNRTETDGTVRVALRRALAP